MQKSGWFVTLSAIAVAIGFGHAGCYTSGVPGGSALGGASATGGSSSQAGSDAGPEGSGGEDAAPPTCDILACKRANQVCDPQSHECVDCAQDHDCVEPGKAVCDTAHHTCVACLSTKGCDPATQRCVQYECMTSQLCESDKQCPGLQICYATDGSAGYCIECGSSLHCSDVAPSVCANDQCTCDNGVCVLPDGSRAFT
jgi:hypothetical protein